jgi:hypothetical protein
MWPLMINFHIHAPFSIASRPIWNVDVTPQTASALDAHFELCIMFTDCVPQAFPQIYQWMTFGITSLLERIWEHQLPLLNLNKKPSPQMIEMCAMLERALAYAHTGNAKVLSSSLMRPFWLVRSLLQQGWPTMAPTIRLIATTTIPVSVSPADWPIVTRSNLPAIASKRSQVITYGLDHFEASVSCSV